MSEAEVEQDDVVMNDATGHHGQGFTSAQLSYLRALPAVANVTERRITYAETFKREALRAYLLGYSPVKIFRKAGLPPRLVGYKRIERAFARWKADREKLLDAQELQDTGASDTEGGDAIPGFSVSDTPYRDMAIGESDDVRDLLIAQQVRYIAELEHQISVLQGDDAS